MIKPRAASPPGERSGGPDAIQTAAKTTITDHGSPGARSAVTVAPDADETSPYAPPGRRPCRLCRRRDRPAVPIGCADGWDLCFPCYRAMSSLRRTSSAAAVNAWTERIGEVLAEAEGWAA